jgi:hypothetical protein
MQASLNWRTEQKCVLQTVGLTEVLEISLIGKDPAMVVPHKYLSRPEFSSDQRQFCIVGVAAGWNGNESYRSI